MSQQHCVDVLTTLCECCVYFDQNPNIATTLSQHWPMLANIGTMFRQRCVNFVAMSLSMLGTDIETTFRQCCVNAWQRHPQHWGLTLRQCSGNVV